MNRECSWIFGRGGPSDKEHLIRVWDWSGKGSKTIFFSTFSPLSVLGIEYELKELRMNVYDMFRRVSLRITNGVGGGLNSMSAFYRCSEIIIIIIIIIRQFIRRRNMSVKSLQERRTENTLLVSSYKMYDCRNRWVLRLFLKVDNVDAVRMSDGRLFHAAGPATQNARLPRRRLVRGSTRSPCTSCRAESCTSGNGCNRHI